MGYLLAIALGEKCDVVLLGDDSDNVYYVHKNIYAKFGFKFIEEPPEIVTNDDGDQIYTSTSDDLKYLLVESKDQIDAIIKRNLEKRGGKRRTKKRKSKRYKFKRH